MLLEHMAHEQFEVTVRCSTLDTMQGCLLVCWELLLDLATLHITIVLPSLPILLSVQDGHLFGLFTLYSTLYGDLVRFVGRVGGRYNILVGMFAGLLPSLAPGFSPSILVRLFYSIPPDILHVCLHDILLGLSPGFFPCLLSVLFGGIVFASLVHFQNRRRLEKHWKGWRRGSRRHHDRRVLKTLKTLFWIAPLAAPVSLLLLHQNSL
jgi:hypothetical protein